MTLPEKVRKILVNLEGRQVSIPATECIVYLAQAYTDPSNPFPTHVHVTSHLGNAWTFLRQSITAGGYGHVVAFDVTLPNRPHKLKCLGRIDGPTKEPIIP
ncbi:hypothetical protein ABZU32_09440 [Sphaerisporangium sp. NPDC005288]|uniref:hypothetical protein n=1 Tax=Sphaerisporangium sp. NPDC005288 TaxID=3155114 RepID=UPI0033BB6950